MKKVYIISICVIVSLVISIIVAINLYEEYSFNGIEEIYSIETNYIYNTKDDNKIEMLCYSNDPKSFLKEYKEVQATLKNSDDSSILSCEIESVKRVSTHNYKDERYYGYKLYISVTNVNQSFNIKDCILVTRDLEITIGNLTVTSAINKSIYLDFTKIYAIGNEHLGYKSINAFVITFQNKSNQPKYINDIYIGDFNYCDLSKAKELKEDIDYNTDINEHINYQPFNYSVNNASIVIPANDTIKYLIPVYYTTRAFLGNTLVYIDNQLYIDNFNYITNYDDIDIYERILTNGKLSNS